MATQKQKEAAKGNIEKTQEARQEMSHEKRTSKQPKGKKRETPGATGEGEFYHIEVRPKEEFKTFRTQDVGEKGGLERVGGQRENGSWDTVKWLVSKEMAHVENGKLVADHPDAKELFDELSSKPKHIEGDRFKAKDRPKAAEKDNPTGAHDPIEPDPMNPNSIPVPQDKKPPAGHPKLRKPKEIL